MRAEIIPFPTAPRPRVQSEISCDLGRSIERMILVQMQAYPAHWPEQDRRELAEHHLFGKPMPVDATEQPDGAA
jgi:hypothetical protein